MNEPAANDRDTPSSAVTERRPRPYRLVTCSSTTGASCVGGGGLVSVVTALFSSVMSFTVPAANAANDGAIPRVRGGGNSPGFRAAFFAPAIPVPDSATDLDTLVAFLGRQP